ncbi:MAG TPA: phosphoribosylformylglycinamidine synthase subunit PurL [Dehalococcoidales bacterium]|nr:phosphoribosylformylglycinamidine synthase subunit PurL [Dehalococcoidales bacterium]
MGIDKRILEEVALSEAEYDLIVRRLGREPTITEIGMFGSLWSEHCGYKHSKPLFRFFPALKKRVLADIGAENAGAVAIGGGLAVVMKVESHNHPSAIEPYQGAASGYGGVARDILTMGARPVAAINSLRFGPLDNPHNRHLFRQAVAGFTDYIKELGIPCVAGEVFFSGSYSANPLVNAMSAGIVAVDKMVRARASGVGNLLMIVGARTGRDGVHGASGLASKTFEEEPQTSTAVLSSDPVMEKRLIEACLELAGTGWLVGMQDLGAAGLTSSTVEMAASADSGIEIDVLKVPCREEGITPYEIMLSETQERMLVIVKKGYEDKVAGLFRRWGLESSIIGRVTDDGLARIKEGDKIVAEAPAKLLTDPPMYQYRVSKPKWLSEIQVLELKDIPDLALNRAQSVFLQLLASPNICSREWIFKHADASVQTDVVPPGGDGGVVRLEGSKRALSFTVDANGRYCYLDPYAGGSIAVAEASRNLVCTGAQPLAVTDSLNLGNPEKKDVYYQLKECIRGIGSACRKLGVPVISGNVSLYNEAKAGPIYPTPVCGMVGLIDDIDLRCDIGFSDEGNQVFLLGGDLDGGELGGSEYLELVHGLVRGRPRIDLALEKRVQTCCLKAIRQGVVASAHDCSEGGLAVTLAECCLRKGFGFEGKGWRIKGRLDAALFGEAQSRIVVSVKPAKARRLEEMAAASRVPLTRLGVVGGRRFTIEGCLDLPLEQIDSAWRESLAKILA